MTLWCYTTPKTHWWRSIQLPRRWDLNERFLFIEKLQPWRTVLQLYLLSWVKRSGLSCIVACDLVAVLIARMLVCSTRHYLHLVRSGSSRPLTNAKSPETGNVSIAPSPPNSSSRSIARYQSFYRYNFCYIHTVYWTFRPWQSMTIDGWNFVLAPISPLLVLMTAFCRAAGKCVTRSTTLAKICQISPKPTFPKYDWGKYRSAADSWQCHEKLIKCCSLPY